MNNTPGTIAVFRKHEARLDSELERDLTLFSSRSIGVKQVCCREYSRLDSYSCLALEWGIHAEKQWVTEERVDFVTAHFVFLEPWEAHDPLLLRCKVQAGRLIHGQKNIAISKSYGSNISLIFKAGLGQYIVDRMYAAGTEIGQTL